MLTPDLFEELLATYPAEKRELARQVYYRFAEGDSTQFFTQLFIVLDIYAHYAERVPQAVIEANQSAQTNLTKLRPGNQPACSGNPLATQNDLLIPFPPRHQNAFTTRSGVLVSRPQCAPTSPNSRAGSPPPLGLPLDLGWSALPTVQPHEAAIR